MALIKRIPWSFTFSQSWSAEDILISSVAGLHEAQERRLIKDFPALDVRNDIPASLRSKSKA
jgi:hypothetical protein